MATSTDRHQPDPHQPLSLVQTVNARDLHAFLQASKDFSTLIKDRVRKYAFAEGVDYVLEFSPKLGKTSGGRPSIEYHLSLDMAKELAMVERNDKGKEARLYFIECEPKAKAAPVPAELSRMELIQLAKDAEKEKLALQAVVEEQAAKLEGFNRIADGCGALTIRAAAKSQLGMRRSSRC
ncbi:hypothetical protein G5B88_14710 [Herbaspirillum seropedicae]|uniref:Phage anti-repressor protein n=1 Tax=Herbaspirillum seropedicae (strain SmR1) TaxID=757424 RepID=D8IZQ7_HERSS|nr:antA/AntB antirepressor family protein [Herbaspirillum seropedicae]ADJ64397.1 phage anti-repressor protein [Herbaspirillum seropedicae SmR1]UMU24273.1 hypothetical protein G5B88_14710 [Herbaspirillum seropedicae]